MTPPSTMGLGWKAEVDPFGVGLNLLTALGFGALILIHRNPVVRVLWGCLLLLFVYLALLDAGWVG